MQAEREGPGWLRKLKAWRPAGMGHRKALKIVYVVVVIGVLPATLILALRDPVQLMAASGIVATIHTPFIIIPALVVNYRLPEPARPGLFYMSAMGVAGLFYTGFAVLYFASLSGSL